MHTTKSDRYELLLKQVSALLAGETNLIANMANTVAAIHEAMGFWWTGYYLVEGQELVLGPFQGPVACTRIPYGKGVCGTAWQRLETIVVPDVSLFPGHIACSSESKSEIVVPVLKSDFRPLSAQNPVLAVLDIDSRDFNTFDDIDAHYLSILARLPFAPLLFPV